VAGPLIGLTALVLLKVGNKPFGVSNNLRHLCAALAPRPGGYLRYDWRKEGGWNLAFFAGIVGGGLIAARLLPGGPPAIAQATHDALQGLGVRDFEHLAPNDVFAWWRLLRWKGIATILGGGFLVGFGTAWAGGCTSGHGVLGLASLDRASFVAVLGFFAGGLFATFVLLPVLLR
jgi:uncharacterized membrane protein YedE/YeeE